MIKTYMYIVPLLLASSQLIASQELKRIEEKDTSGLKALRSSLSEQENPLEEETLEKEFLSLMNREDTSIKSSEKDSKLLPANKPTSCYSDFALDKYNGAVSLIEYSLDNNPLAVLVFERVNNENQALQPEYRAFYLDKAQVSQDSLRLKGAIYNLNHEHQALLKISNVKSWKLDIFHINNALDYLERQKENNNLIFLSEAVKPNEYKTKSLLNFTSATFAAKILEDCCHIVGLNNQPFKSELTVKSLLKVAQTALPSPLEKPAEKNIGPLASFFYMVYQFCTNQSNEL